MKPTPIALLLAQATQRIAARTEELQARVDSGDESVWSRYLETAVALKRLAGEEHQSLATTRDVAEKFGVSMKTARKKARVLGLEPVRLGRRGSAAIRWRSA